MLQFSFVSSVAAAVTTIASRFFCAATLATASAAAGETRRRLEAGHAAEQRLSARLQELRSLLLERQAAAEALRVKAEEARASARLAAEAAAELERQLTSLDERERAAHQMTAVVEAELRNESSRRGALVSQLEELGRQLPEMERQLEEAARRAREAEGLLATLRSAVEQRRGELGGLEAQAAALDREAAESLRRRYELEQRAATAEESAAGQESSLASAREALAEAASRAEEAAEAERRASAQLARLQPALARFEEMISTCRGSAAQLRSQIQQLGSEIEALKRQEQEHSGWEGGSQAILRSEHASRVSGVLARELSVPERFEVAIEAALGRRLQSLIVEDVAHAQDLLGFLREARRGRTSLVVLEASRVDPRPPQAGQPQELAVGGLSLGLASRLVGCPRHLREPVARLLDHTLVVEDLREGMSLFAELLLQNGKAPPTWQIVTLQGDVIESSGVVTGGGEVRASALLARQRKLREMPLEQAALAERLARVEHTIASLELGCDRVRREVAELLAESRQLASSFRRLQQEGTEREREVNRLEHALMLQRSLSAESRAEAQRAGERHEQALGARAEVAARLRAVHDELDGLVANLDEAVRASTGSAEGSAGLRVHIELALRSLQELERRLAEVSRSLEKRRLDLAGQHDTAVQLESERSRLSAASQERQTARQSRAEDARVTEEQAVQAQRALAELLRSAQELEEDLSGARQEVGRLEGMYRELAIEERRGADRCETLRDAIREELACDSKELPEAADGEESPNGLKRQLDRARSALRALGEVNPNAVSEFAELERRHAFLSTQAEDLRQARSSLQAVVAELDEFTQQRFASTFRSIAAEFGAFFQMLFKGGAVDMSLTQPRDLAATGVEIVAQPPGKRSQELASLSGGERSLVAIALLFAILKTSPLPFCLLDEVDAALDESNIGRFADALRTLTERTQFLIVTHNRATMTLADTIYGTSLERDGSTRVFSLRMADGR